MRFFFPSTNNFSTRNVFERKKTTQRLFRSGLGLFVAFRGGYFFYFLSNGEKLALFCLFCFFFRFGIVSITDFRVQFYGFYEHYDFVLHKSSKFDRRLYLMIKKKKKETGRQ